VPDQRHCDERRQHGDQQQKDQELQKAGQCLLGPVLKVLKPECAAVRGKAHAGAGHREAEPYASRGEARVRRLGGE
jgi:hypothetical protein